ncbi:MAG: endonuclease/exonuclease/phosphatase family metal-dependent hydrolase [Bradymonadia bacterium]|jgi:endonuclease/exonuclease/phosphatase family metal-dependent hydrolase
MTRTIGITLALTGILASCGVDQMPPSFLAGGNSGQQDVSAGARTDTGSDAAVDAQPDGAETDGTLDSGVPGLADVPEGTEPDVVVVTFNVERLFDAVCQSNNCEDGFESAPSEAQVRYKVGIIADGIRQTGAHVALLQEVENLDVLQDLTAELGAEWNVSLIGETGGTASLDVAVLARNTTLLASESHRGDVLFRPDGSRTSFAREFMEVHLEYGGGRLIVFNAHFKAKSNDDPGRREAEAIAARQIVTRVIAERPDAIVVLGGDLNDVPGSAPIEQLEAEGDLARVAAILPEGEDWTHEFRNTRNAIDHLYLATGASGGITPNSVWVARDASGGLAGSDHAALRAGFSFP